MSKFNNVVQFTDESCMFEMYDITLTESYVDSVCEEYNIDITSDIETATEGVVGKIIDLIKGLFKKVIDFLVKAWKFIVDFVKKSIQ